MNTLAVMVFLAFVLLLALCSYGAAGQSPSGPDYAVLENGDTLRGKVRITGRHAREFRIKTDSGNRKLNTRNVRTYAYRDVVFDRIPMKLYASELRAYDHEPGTSTPKFVNDTAFAVRMVQGTLNMYWHKKQGNDHYLIGFGDTVYTGLYTHRYYVVSQPEEHNRTVAKERYLFTDHVYRGLLFSLAQGCAAAADIAGTTALSPVPLTEYAVAYNRCSGSDPKFIWKPVRPRSKFGVTAGMGTTQWQPIQHGFFSAPERYRINTPLTLYGAMALELEPAAVRKRFVLATRFGFVQHRASGELFNPDGPSTLAWSIRWTKVSFASLMRWQYGRTVEPFVGFGPLIHFPFSFSSDGRWSNTLYNPPYHPPVAFGKMELGLRLAAGATVSRFGLQAGVDVMRERAGFRWPWAGFQYRRSFVVDVTYLFG